MDMSVRITTLVIWASWLAGAALVALDVLDVLDEAGNVGLLVALFGSTAWVACCLQSVRERELVAFDHGRQFERSARDHDVIRMPGRH